MTHPLMTATPATPALSALFLACVSPSGHGSAGSPREPPTERSPAPEVAAMVTVAAVAHYAQETAQRLAVETKASPLPGLIVGPPQTVAGQRPIQVVVDLPAALRP